MKLENISIGRLYLVNKMPYLSMAIWSLFPVPVKGLETFAVDKNWRLYYDPDLDWDAQETAAVLYHEIWHLLRGHPYRAKPDYDSFIWNLACDCEINDDIEAENIFKMPGEPVTPQRFNMDVELMAEEYYEQLQKRVKVVHIDALKRGVGRGDCGSAADGVQRPWENAPSDAPSIGKVESEVIAKNVAEEIVKAKSIGNVPYGIERWANELLAGKVDWKKELKFSILNAVSDVAGMVDYSYRKPSRRQSIMRDVILPSMRQPSLRVAVVVDTSGSMGTDELGQALSEIHSIIRLIGAHNEVSVLSVDAAVHNVQRVFSARQVKLFGGGGTDMGVGITTASKLRPEPNVIIVLTDGMTPWPETKVVKQPVIAGILTIKDSWGGNWHKDVPSWIKKVDIPIG